MRRRVVWCTEGSIIVAKSSVNYANKKGVEPKCYVRDFYEYQLTMCKTSRVQANMEIRICMQVLVSLQAHSPTKADFV